MLAILCPGWVVLAASLHAVAHFAYAPHVGDKFVSRCEKALRHAADPYSGRGAGEDDVAGKQWRDAGQARDDLGNWEDHVRGSAVLDLFAVDGTAQFDGVG